MKKIFCLLLLSLMVQSVWSQSGEGYDPENPGDPDVYYTLMLEATPQSGGTVSFNQQKLPAGQSIYVSASPRMGYEFKRWMMGDSLVSTDSWCYFTMPENNVVLTAYFEWNPTYDPQNPGDPASEGYSHHVYVYASPSAGGYFNSSSFTLVEGNTTNIYAYPRDGYRFESWMCNGEVVSTDNPLTIKMGTTDIAYTATFVYNPVSPGEPSPNVFNAATGEVIIDNFTPGSLNSAIYTAVGSSDNYSLVQSILVIGRMTSSDFGFAYNYRNCSLIDLSRTTGYTEIPSWSFEGAEALEELFLPMNVEKVGENAFKGCSSLKHLYLYATMPPLLAEGALGGLDNSVTLHVPSASVVLYAASDGWNQLTIQSLDENEKSITVNLPGMAGEYKNMTLELQNMQSGQVYRCLVTDRTSYTFFGLMRNTYYNIYLKNSNGVVLGEINNVALENDNLNVSFDSIHSMQDVMLSVVTPDGGTVTSDVSITWLDEQGNYMRQGNQVSELLTGTNIQYRVKLSKELAMEYVQPADMAYQVKDGENAIVLTLSPIKQIAMSGYVKDAATKQGILGATVSISQMLNGKYSKTIIANTDSKGYYSAIVFNAPTSLAVSAYNYVNQTAEVAIDPLAETVALDDITMTSIIGATINVRLTYTPSVIEGETAETQNWYSDYQNVAYSIYNLTSEKEISQVSERYPQLVVLGGVNVGDRLALTARSKKDAFMPVTVVNSVDSTNHLDITFNITQFGGIKASFNSSANSSVVGVLYDKQGYLVSCYDYDVDASLSITELKDDNYTLVTMGKDTFLNSIYNLSQLSNVGLIEGVDYCKNQVIIRSGTTVLIDNETIPKLDTTKYKYIGDNNSFTVNKSSIVAGNYLTFSSYVDFLTDYVSAISGVELIVDIPESATFVDGSLLIGSSVSEYTLENNRIIIPLTSYKRNDKVRFCVIPTASGTFAPSAFVKFTVDNEEKVLAIGAASYNVESLSIIVPRTVANKSITVRGAAVPGSTVEIFDNNVNIGRLETPADGSWSTVCELANAYNLSTHSIYAKVIINGIDVLSETKNCFYDKDANGVKTVTMTHYNAYYKNNMDVVFDMESGTNTPGSYYFYTTADFSFIVDFINNDTSAVSNVNVYAFDYNGKSTRMPATFDSKTNKWVAKHRFSSNDAPVNVNVEYSSFHNLTFDEEYSNTIINNYSSDDETNDKETAEYLQLLELLSSFIENEDNPNDSLYSILDRLSSLEEVIVEDTIKVNSFIEELNKCTTLIGVRNVCDSNEMPEDEDYKLIVICCPPDYNGIPAQHCGNDYTPTYTYTKQSQPTGIVRQDIPTGRWDVSNESSGNTSVVNLVSNENGDRLTINFNNQIPEVIEGTTEELREALEVMNNLCNSYLSTYSHSGLHIDLIDRIVLNRIGVLEQEQRMYSRALNSFITNKKPLTENREVLRELLQRQKNNRVNLAQAKRIRNITRYGGQALNGIAGGLLLGNHIGNSLSTTNDWDLLIERINEYCDEDEAERLANEARAYQRWVNMRNTTSGVIQLGTTCLDVVGKAGAIESGGLSLFLSLASFGINMGTQYWQNNVDFTNEQNYRSIVNKLRDCMDEDDEGNPTGEAAPIEIIWDPSGYVYEGVSSNRLQGVTATAYYMETTEDMYGVLHEEPRVWDAEEYAQENPLFTDENGMYQWDVPQGLWQVKFEKEGYETTYSEWLPVPPPQLEVNIGMVQNRQPEVIQAHAYRDGVEVEFDKYMLPALLNTDNILVSQNGEYVEGEVRLLNEETAYADENVTYASKIRFVPTTPFTANEVTLTVANRVRSYAGLQMQDSYQQTFDIEQELNDIKVDSIVNVVYEGALTLAVEVLPAEASAGKVLHVKSSSPMIAAVETESYVLDSDGKASIVVTGELPGSASLTYTIEGYDLTAATIVNVDMVSVTTCAMPTASIASGSVVEKGTAVELFCTTEGATIFYTLDGSCPCNETAARKVYDGTPIIINESVTIKAMATAPNMYESEVAEFNYIVDVSGIEEVTINGQIQVWPLPVRDKLNVTAGGKTIKNVAVSSMNGVLVASSANVATKVTLDVSMIPTGMYIINVTTDNGSFSRKILKVD